MQRKQLTLVIVSLLVVVLSVSLAYFTAQIIGKGKTVDVSSTNLQIASNDLDGEIAGSYIEPGWQKTKTFIIQNNGKTERKYNIVIKDLMNTFVTNGCLKYKVTSTNNGYNMTEYKDIPKSSIAADTILAYSVSIPVGVTQSYTIEFKYINDESVDQSDDMGKKLSGTLFITEGTEEPTLYAKLLADKTTRPGARTDFSTVLTNDNTNTLYTSTEDSKTVYYFAGNATDNWVKFGKYQNDLIRYRGYSTTTSNSYVEYSTMDECTSASSYNKNCTEYKYANTGDDLYWRIIRTNSDGSIRLLYHGTSTTAENAYIGESAFNTTYDDSMYVAYMYGTIKTYIDNWYAKNMTSYTKYLSTTAVYCNDATYTVSGEDTLFGAYNRLNTKKEPKYDCAAGNGKLTYPIALMTADEVSFAGGVYGTNAPTWYYYNSAKGSSTGTTWWWLLSPYNWDGFEARVFGVGGSSGPGNLSYTNVDGPGGVRPAVSLKSCVKTSGGDGSANAPYTIEESTSGC